MLHRPALARYWLPPLVLTLLVFVVSQALAWMYVGEILRWLGAEPDAGQGGCEGVLLSWSCLRVVGGTLGHGALAFLAWLCAACVALGFTFLASMLLAAPFNDALSEAVERLRGGQAAPPFRWAALLRDALRSVVLELGKLAIFLLVMAPLALASWLVPGVGQLAYAVVGGLLASVYFALDFTDWPAGRRGWGLRQRLAQLREHPAPMLGFGGGEGVVLWVPVVNVLQVPAAVIGGTLLFLDLEQGFVAGCEKA